MLICSFSGMAFCTVLLPLSRCCWKGRQGHVDPCVCVCVCVSGFTASLSQSTSTVVAQQLCLLIRGKKKTVLRKSFQLTSDSLAAWNVFFSTLHYVLVQGQIPALEDFLTFLLSLIWIKIYCVHVRVSYVNASHLTVHVSLPSSLCAAEMLVY